MVSKHITRDYSAHRRNVVRPYDEYTKLEIFSFDPQYTKLYIAEENTLEFGENHEQTSWKSWTCYRSKDKTNDMVFDLHYLAKENGEYRIDILYEKSNHIYSDSKYDTGDTLIGNLSIVNNNGTEIYNADHSFEGENNVTKRISIFKQLNKDDYSLTLHIPPNCFFMGVIIRKLIKYVGDNYYGGSLGSEEGDLAVTNVTVTNSGMTKPTELSATILYDDALECDDSPSGFYIDYHDEVNFYVKDDNGDVQQIFGGYVSSILPDSDRTKLTLACADRLIDGQNKYVLDQIVLQGGTKEQTEDEYSDGMTVNFDSYPQSLQYICNCHEVSLKNNISKDYTVDGEKFHDGFTIEFGTDKTIKEIKSDYGYSTPSKNYIMVRNASKGDLKQVWTVYNAKDNAKLPIDITDYGYMHITYGLGEKKTEYQTKTTETVDTADTTAGSQKYSKCGVSSDGKTIMAIGLPSAGKDSKSGWTKAIFKRKCPHCGSDKLVWDIFYGSWGYASCKGTKEGGGVEGHIFCKSCDADYSCQGHEHISGSKYSLTKVGSIVSSSKSEAQKLRDGKMSAVSSTTTEVTPKSIFEAISKKAKKYTYKLYGNTCSTWSCMKKSGYGDCWAFSEMIFNELKSYKVKCKIVQYSTNMSERHRTVRYVNESGNWADFPYRDYGFHNYLYPTSKSSSGVTIQEYKDGSNIGNAKSVTSTSKTETTTVTTTTGYDKDKPFQAYILMTYSIDDQSFSAEKNELGIKFTQTAPLSNSLNTGLPLYWINNTVKQTTLKLSDNQSLTDYLNTIHGEGHRYYLHTIQFISPKQVGTEDNKDIDWYKSDNSTNDDSSCKLNLYQITFDDNGSTEPSELNSCGKSVNSLLDQIVKDAKYYVDMTYAVHRTDDRINFRVLNQSNARYTATEGDNNNILAWNSISYTPISALYNNATQVFKGFDNLYYFVDTRNPQSILNYGEQCSLSTSNEAIGEKEAYFNAVHSDKFNPVQTYNFTITVKNMPNLRIGDLVKVVANAKKLTTVKEVNSIKVSFDYDKMPRIHTELGLGELSPDIQLKENIRTLRTETKKESTAFSTSAIAVTDPIYYEWDR